LSAYSVSADHVFWRHVDPPAGFYIIESGDLRVLYEFANIFHDLDESMVASMVAGTVAGEMSELSRRLSTSAGESPG